MVLNVLSQQKTRYIPVRADLEAFLKGKYNNSHPGYNFNIQHSCDRWSFDAPDTISEKEIDALIDSIDSR